MAYTKKLSTAAGRKRLSTTGKTIGPRSTATAVSGATAKTPPSKIRAGTAGARNGKVRPARGAGGNATAGTKVPPRTARGGNAQTFKQPPATARGAGATTKKAPATARRRKISPKARAHRRRMAKKARG